MTTEQLIESRKSIGYTQTEMADALGMSLRGIQDLEAGKSTVRRIHELAIDRLRLELAVERQDPMLASKEMRGYAVSYARMVGAIS